MNKFTVDYDKETLVLSYNGETFNFSLKDGDKGDFWNSFIDSNGVLRDVNFSQEDENDSANLSVYSLVKKENIRYAVAVWVFRENSTEEDDAVFMYLLVSAENAEDALEKTRKIPRNKNFFNSKQHLFDNPNDWNWDGFDTEFTWEIMEDEDPVLNTENFITTDTSSGEAIQEKELIGDAVRYFNS